MTSSVPVVLGSNHQLTSSQELIWTSQRLNPDAPLANMAIVNRFRKAIDPERLAQAFERVVQATPILRTMVTEVDGRPVLTVAPKPPATTEIIELTEDELDDWMAVRVSVPLDVSVAGYDSVVIHLPEAPAGRQWVWWLDTHHLFTDAASSALIYQATAAEYFGSPLELTRYRDTAAELAGTRDTKRWVKAAAHWAEDTSRAVSETQLYQPDNTQGSVSARLSVPMQHRQAGLDELLAGPFRALSTDLALLTTMSSAIAVFAWRVGGNEATTIGVPIHHRSSKAAKATIGPLVELFPLDVAVAPDDTFATLHKRVSRSVMTLLANAQPGTAPRQRFDIVLNVHGATFGPFGDIDTDSTWHHPGHIDSHHRLRVQVLDYTGEGQLEVGLDLNHNTANATHRERAQHHFGAVLDAMIADPDAEIGSFSLLTEAEEQQLLGDYNASGGTQTEPATTVTEAIYAALDADRGRIALTDSTGETPVVLTAGEVVDRTAAIALWLRAQGVMPGDCVGIEMGPSIDAVLAIHGVLRAGAAFVPIDPSYPDRRREHLRTVSDAVLVLETLPTEHELAERSISLQDMAMPSLDDRAYVIFTSGSTGLPKGVPITHRGLANYIAFAHDAYIDHDAPVIPLFSSLSFDLTITSLMLPWLAGGTMTVHPEGGVTALRQIAEERVATFAKATPSHLELLIRMVEPDHPLRSLVVGGEAFLSPLALRLKEVFGDKLRIFNEYGPTECVVGCMIHEFNPATDHTTEVPIGKPAPSTELFVLDAHHQPVPAGAIGELYVHRPGMLSGYLGEDRSGDSIVSLPRLSPNPLYRTGDQVRMIDDQTMVYLGRIDDQTKVRGVRLEPGEIESALIEHPGITRAVARVWTPEVGRDVINCVRCGIPSNVPNVTFDAQQVCSTCHAYDAVAPQADAWFRTEADLQTELAAAAEASTGDYDVLHLLSGGKDSTYALYRLVEMGARVYALTLDNGFISEGAKDNARQAVADLGVDHEFATTEAMNEIFRDSLERFSNVCQGCYKTIYTLAINRADELGIPAIVTGLSRGQFFETRLVPGMFDGVRFDEAANETGADTGSIDAIDNMVTEARKAYHRTDDAVQRSLDVSRFETDEVLDRIRFLDFYRYVDVALGDMFDYLDNSTTWQRPPDTGRSTNCLINSAGIFVHKLETGHHNYALPYSWDVKLGHKTRQEAIEELDDPMDDDELAAITRMLAEVGYEPRPAEMLTAWYASDAELTAAELRAHLSDRIPEHALPTAFVRIDDVPLTTNGKVDTAALPTPTRAGRVLPGIGRKPESTTEKLVAEVWSAVLGVEGLSSDDDFFSLGGASLDALEMIVILGDRLGRTLPEILVFQNRTVATLARSIDAAIDTEEETAAGGIGASAASNQLDRGPRRTPTTNAMTAAEESLLYEWRMNPAAANFNGGQIIELPDSIEAERLVEAVRAVVAHQPTLHTSYTKARRIIPAADALKISHHTLEATVSAGAATDPAIDALASLTGNLNAQPFDLEAGPLVTADLITEARDDPGRRRWLMVRTHHISSDAGSLEVFWDLVDQAYRGDTLSPLTVTYAQHGAWQATGNDDADTRGYWRQQLEVAPAELAIHRDTGDAAADTRGDRSDRLRLQLTREQLRTGPGRTALAPILAAAAAVLARRHDGDVVEIGVAASTRNRPEIDDVVGYFTNVLPLRIDANANHRFGDTVARIDDLLAGGLGHRTLPFAEIVREARAHGLVEPSGRIIVAFNERQPFSLGGHALQPQPVISAGAVGDLALVFSVGDDGIDLELESTAGLLTAADADELLAAFDAAAIDGITDANRTLGTLDPSLSSIADGPALTVDATTSIPALIAAASATDPSSPAVRCGESQLSYQQVQAGAFGLAAQLSQAGVRPRDRVGVLLERSVLWPVAIRACWLLGASYVPIDPTLPGARISSMANDVNLRAALVSVGVDTAELPEATPVIELSSMVDVADGGSGAEAIRPAPIDPDSEAYVIFTSGSTGRPKGVSISHANLAASTAARRQFYPDPVSRYLLLSALSFDSSVAGLFWTLSAGGELIIPTERQVGDIDELLALTRDSEPSHLLCVPSLYRGLLDRNRGLLSGLAVVVVAGEACPPALIGRHHGLVAETVSTDVSLVNEYGPTEATVWATAQLLNRTDSHGATVPIGPPIPGIRVLVVDHLLRPVPFGVTGELLIAGPTVSSGYVGNATETNQRFVQLDSFATGLGVATDFYRTGDRVTARRDGTLLFVGRIDEQLSLGGIRVEPAEIEAVLGTVDGIDDIAVAADGRRLVALVATGQPQLSDAHTAIESEARERAGSRLPEALRPHRYIQVDDIPRSRNGKIDRGEVARVAATTPDSPAGTPMPARDSDAVSESETLALIRHIWAEVFATDHVAAGADFFDMGGDSLIAVELVMALEAELGQRVAIGELIEFRTPARLAQRWAPAVGTTEPNLGDDGVAPAGRQRNSAGSIEWLQQGRSDRRPLLLLPALGDLLLYRTLVADLDDDLPVMGLRLPLDSRGRPLPTLERQAGVLLREVRRAQRHGPYRLLGWSSGGLLAWELARQLREANQVVDQVYLVDTYPRPVAADKVDTQPVAPVPPNPTRLIVPLDAAPSPLESESEHDADVWQVGRFGTAAGQLSARARRFRERNADAGAVEAVIRRQRQRAFWRRASVSADRYVPGPMGGGSEAANEAFEVIFVAASATDPANTIIPWRAIQPDFDVVNVEGRHSNESPDFFLNAERAGQIADAVSQRLRD